MRDCERDPEHACEKGIRALADHSRGVARLLREFAQVARPSDALFQESAHVTGLLHDLGKYQPQWQRWAREYQRLKTGVVPAAAIAHTDFDPKSEADNRIAPEATTNVGPRPNHSSRDVRPATSIELSPNRKAIVKRFRPIVKSRAICAADRRGPSLAVPENRTCPSRPRPAAFLRFSRDGFRAGI